MSAARPSSNTASRTASGRSIWVDDGLAYAIAGNADRELLLKVADIVYRQSAPASGKTKLPPPGDKPS